MTDYYSMTEYISNSMLGELQKVLRLDFEDIKGLQYIFDFGNLVDALVTEESKIDFVNKVLHESGRELRFEENEWQKALKMREALLEHPLVSMLIQDMKFQYIILRKAFQMEYNGIKFALPVRCKFDGLKRKVIALDIKTTSCTTMKAFLDSINHFDYDRQGAFYMDLAGVDKMVYAGVSKTMNKRTKKHDVFIHCIERGDATYLSGKAKYNKLGYQYYHYIYNLDLNLVKQSILENENTIQKNHAFLPQETDFEIISHL